VTGTVGTRVRDCRVSAQLTQTELADRLGMSRSSVANIEAGRQTIKVDLVHRIATVLDADAGFLVTGRVSVLGVRQQRPAPRVDTARLVERARKQADALAATLGELVAANRSSG
jgi:transcriptional regulator with XRE-family HTH domain